MKAHIIISVMVGLVAAYTLSFWAFNLAENNTWLIYIQSLYHFEVVMGIGGFILNELANKDQKIIDYIKEINTEQEMGFIEIEKSFMKYYPELLPLYKEMNQHNALIQQLPVPQNIDKTKRMFYENVFCNIIIQRIEDIFASASQLGYSGDFERIKSKEFADWVSAWRVWFHSPTLRRVWQSNRSHLFAKETRDFIDNSIIMGKPYTDLTVSPVRFD